jgi:hypothetical protein
MVFLLLVIIHSWDLNISDETSMSISESHLTRLVAAQGIDASDHYIRHGNYIPTVAHNLLSGVQSHEVEAAMQISTWSKRNFFLGRG